MNFIVVLNINFSMLFPMFLIGFFAVAYSLVIYSNTQHSAINKTFKGVFHLRVREIRNIVIHSFLLFSLSLRINSLILVSSLIKHWIVVSKFLYPVV